MADDQPRPFGRNPGSFGDRVEVGLRHVLAGSTMDPQAMASVRQAEIADRELDRCEQITQECCVIRRQFQQ